MKLILFSLFIAASSWAKPTVLVSYFDPFGRAKVNNSETVAKLLVSKLAVRGNDFEISLCKLETKFDLSSEQLKDCIAALPERPLMVISLGETGCDLKVELMGRNNDRSYHPDNAGVERRNTPVVKDAPPAMGLTYPLDEMYCALDSNQRKNVIVSNNAGTFVCNNLTYLTAWNESDLNFGFIHVPQHTCRDLETKNPKVAESLFAMIARGVEVTQENPVMRKLPVTKDELRARREEFSSDKCLSTFYKEARAWDEKAWWNIFGNRMN